MSVTSPAVLDTRDFLLDRSRGRMKETDSAKRASADSEPLSFAVKLPSGSVSSSYRDGIAGGCAWYVDSRARRASRPQGARMLAKVK